MTMKLGTLQRGYGISLKGSLRPAPPWTLLIPDILMLPYHGLASNLSPVTQHASDEHWRFGFAIESVTRVPTQIGFINPSGTSVRIVDLVDELSHPDTISTGR